MLVKIVIKLNIYFDFVLLMFIFMCVNKFDGVEY